MATKKTFALLSVMMLALQIHAGYYIVGNDPFGDWAPCTGVEMTEQADGTYRYSAFIDGTVWFVLADNLVEDCSDWDTFNNTMRIGPLNGDETIEPNQWITTQKSGGDHGAFKFIGKGSEYTITFNPVIMKLKIEGDYGWPPLEYTVVGYPIAVFGTEWDPYNTDNNMIEREDGLYELTKYDCLLAQDTEILFKVVCDHDWSCAWPKEDFYAVYVEETRYYDVHWIFDPEMQAIDCQLYSNIIPPPLYPDVYIMGEVNGNRWSPDIGYKMDSEDNIIYTARIVTLGENIDDVDGIGSSYFSFTSKLSEDDYDWYSIAPYRFGATEDGFKLSNSHFGTTIALESRSNSFKIPAGTYDLTLNRDMMTMVISKVDELLYGDVNGDHEVNISDVNAVIDMILSSQTDTIGDLNGDMEVGLADVNILIELILK